MKCPFCIKICSKCKRLLVANNLRFTKQKTGFYGLRADCKICEKQWRMKNKEKKAKYDKMYQQVHKEEKMKYFKQYYHDNKEEIKEQHREYRNNNPQKVFNQNQKRRKLEECQGEGITKDQWYEMMIFFNWECAYSGIQLNKDNRSIDHIIPLNKNGENNIWNCIPMLISYNSSKNDNDWLEWYIQQDFYNEERLNKIYEWIEYANEKYNK